MAVQGQGTANGNNVEIRGTGTGSNHKRWELTHQGNDIYQVKNVNSAKCLDLAAGSTANGGNIQQWNCNTSNVNQQWLIRDAGNGQFYIESMKSGKCVELQGASTSNGTNVQQWDCGNQIHKKWNFNLISSSARFAMDQNVEENNQSIEQTISLPVEIKIYPNPVLDILSIQGVSSEDTFMIYNSSGQKVMTFQGDKVDISRLSNGIYFIRRKNNTQTKFLKH